MKTEVDILKQYINKSKSFSLKIWLYVFLLFIILLIGCGENWRNRIIDIGGEHGGVYDEVEFSFTSLKFLAGEFFDCDGHVFLIAGTEASPNLYNDVKSSVFVFDIDNRKPIIYEKLDNAISMTAICDVGDDIYFGTISSGKQNGCDLYVYNKKIKCVNKLYHFENRGIYDITYNSGDDEVIVGTSDNIAVYGYDRVIGEVRTIKENFSEERYIRSMSYVNGNAFLGIGTSADLIKMDVRSGDYESILPEYYSEQSFVYDQFLSKSDDIYFVLSPSYIILKYNTDEECIQETEWKYENITDLSVCMEKDDQGHIIGNIFYLNHGTIIGRCQYGNLLSYDGENGKKYGLDSSGIIHIWDEDENESIIDLYDYVDGEVSVPNKYAVFADKIYVPGRRFCRYSLTGEKESSFLVNDEPQALFCDEDGIYTANYTESTVYFYPWEVFNKENYSVDFNSSEFLLADIDNQCRPQDLQITKDRKYLLIATGPLYGKYGGAISMYDLNEFELVYTDINIVPNQTISDIALSEFDNCVWLGTSDYGENTSPMYIDAPPHLLLWDYINEEIRMDIELENAELSVNSIHQDNAYVYCLNHYGQFEIYNVNDGSYITKTSNSYRSILGLSDGRVFLMDATSIYCINESCEIVMQSTGFENLNGVVQDIKTGKVFGFEGEQMIDLTNSF